MKTHSAQEQSSLQADRRDRMVWSSRVRLARNLEGISFPGWSGESERAAVWEQVIHAVGEKAGLDAPIVQSMRDLDPLQRLILQERRLISVELATGDGACGVMYEEHGRLSIMVNEEDHLRIQSVAQGLALQDAWRAAQALHLALEERLSFAFSTRYGYLTACPSNVGTGIRASVMVHLAGLRLLGELDAVVRGLERTGFAMRGISGEGSRAHGGFCQISNQRTLGLDEAETLSSVDDMVQNVLSAEQNARTRLSELSPWTLEDAVARAFALVRHARLLPTGEALEHLSAILLGIDKGLIKGVDPVFVQELVRDMQPGHLQLKYNKTLAAVDRDQYRSRHVRQALATMELV